MWRLERGHLDRPGGHLVVLALKGILDGRQVRTHQRVLVRALGETRRVSFASYQVATPRRGEGRLVNGVWRPTMTPPTFAQSYADPFWFGGNSIVYAIQHALLMGADPIYLMGFTLVSGSGYEFGRDNPVSGKPGKYYPDRCLPWLKEVEHRWPGRVRILPGWSGPLYEVFQTARL